MNLLAWEQASMTRVPLGNWCQTPSIWTLTIGTAGAADSVLIRKLLRGRGGEWGAGALVEERGDRFVLDQFLGHVFGRHGRRDFLLRLGGEFVAELEDEGLGGPGAGFAEGADRLAGDVVGHVL